MKLNKVLSKFSLCSDEMEAWTSAEVQQFLLKKKIRQRTTSTLFEAGISGVHLKNFNNNNYTDIGIPLADALIIPMLRDKYLKGGGSSQNEERQIPRRFGEPVGSKIKYKNGSILPCENSNYSLDEPLREFKEFSLGKNVYFLQIKRNMYLISIKLI